MLEDSGVGSYPDLVDFEDFSGDALAAEAPTDEFAIAIYGCDFVGSGPAVEN